MIFYFSEIFQFGKIFIIFILFSFPSFSFLFFSSLLLPLPVSCFLTNSKRQLTRSTNRAAEHSAQRQLPPWPEAQPHVAPLQHPLGRPPLPLLLPPPSSLPQACNATINGAPTPAMAASHGVSHKLIFLCGMTKMDAYDLPLAIPTLNCIRNEL
jgi:hypothetical protein